jgi:hypothetical protein
MATFEAKADIRSLAADLRAAYQQIPCRRFLAACRFIPSPETVGAAVSELIGLSNSNRGEEYRQRLTAIRGRLSIT